MNAARWVSRAAFAGAAVAAVLPFLPPRASADSNANTTTLSFNSQAAAYGVLSSVDISPNPSPVGGLFTQYAPAATSTFNSGGTSRSDAYLAWPGNGGSAVALVCVASDQSAQFCQGVDQATSQTPLGHFPFAWPLQATSTPSDNGKPQYPSFESQFNGQQDIGAGTPVELFPAKAVATATDSDVASDAALNESNLFTGTPAAVTVGQISTSSHQYIDKTGAIVSQATSVLHNITIAGAIQIAEMKSIATVTNGGHGASSIKKSASVTLTGVTAGGQAAQITDQGISLFGQGDNGQLTNALNNQVLNQLQSQGISIKLVKPSVTVSGNTATVDTGGLFVTWQTTISGVPTPWQQVLQALQISCLPPGPECLFNVPNPNATYAGTFKLGDASVGNYAAPGFSFNLGGGGLPVSGSGPTSRFIPGTPGTAGSAGTLTGTSNSVANTTQPPAVATKPASYLSEILKGTSGRLEALFPVFFLVALGVIAGRWPAYPARR